MLSGCFPGRLHRTFVPRPFWVPSHPSLLATGVGLSTAETQLML
jgi:hypothetical protein